MSTKGDQIDLPVVHLVEDKLLLTLKYELHLLCKTYILTSGVLYFVDINLGSSPGLLGQ